MNVVCKNLGFLFAAILLISCSKDIREQETDPNVYLDSTISMLTSQFNSVIVTTNTVVSELANSDLDSLTIRNKLLTLMNNPIFIIEFSYVSPEGILKYIEPKEYQKFEGIDLSNYYEFQHLKESKQPALSKRFLAIEGFYSATLGFPIIKSNNFVGTIDALFIPEKVLKQIINKFIFKKGESIWVMDQGGNQLYDEDSIEIGRNVFTDTLYKNFPSILSAVKLIDSLDSGKVQFEYTHWDTKELMKIEATWKIFRILDRKWKIIFSRKIN